MWSLGEGQIILNNFLPSQILKKEKESVMGFLETWYNREREQLVGRI